MYQAFANNPVNFRDPTGLCTERDVPEGWPPKNLEWVDPTKQMMRDMEKMLRETDWTMMVPVGAGVKFLSSAKIAKELGVAENIFHRVIKPDIVKQGATTAREIGATNPDIGLSDTGQIVFKNVKTGVTKATDLLIDWFKNQGR